MREPELVTLSADFVGVHEIRHTYYSIPGGQREAELSRVLAFENPDRALIFCNTREETGRVAEHLRRQGLDAEAISSDLSQSDREKVMTRMRAAASVSWWPRRGRARNRSRKPALRDQLHLPRIPEAYIHRTGRTGRAGRSGHAISLIGPTEVGSFYYLKLLYKIRPRSERCRQRRNCAPSTKARACLRLRGLLPPMWARMALARPTGHGASDGERLIGCLLRGHWPGRKLRPNRRRCLVRMTAERRVRASGQGQC